MGKIADTLKGLIPSGGQLLNFGSSIASLLGRNSNLDKQLKAQAEENQKNRDYNLMLSQMQNEWNQNQWERENEYNSPVNQMKRFKDAGLNPDLIYGHGTSGNAMQLSGGLTSGAPSSPTDFTALGQKMTLGDAIRSSLDTEMQQAQIDVMRANAEKTRTEAGISKIDLNTKTALENMFEADAEQLLHVYSNANYFVRQKLIELANLEKDYGIKGNQFASTSLDYEMKRIDSNLHEKKSELLLRKLSALTEMSENELSEFIKGTSLRLRGLKAETEIKESDSLWNNTKFLDALPEGLPLLIRLIRYASGK